jgi:superfamily II DNA/RNA helicase
MINDIKSQHKADKNYRGITYSNYLDSGVLPMSQSLKSVPHAVYSGKLSIQEKNKIVQDYNKGKIKHLFVTSAGSEGLDLKGTKLVQITEPH